jgi:hypothetical protein
MRRQHSLRILLLVLCAAAAPAARAFLVFNEGRDQFFINASLTFGYSTNVFDQKVAHGSATGVFAWSATYVRRAGMINVSAGASFSYDEFASVKGENQLLPDLTLTFTKGLGRTTGSWALEAQRQSQPDATVNNRPIDWTYSSTFNARYPVNDRYYITSATTILGILYDNTALFSNLNTYGEDVGVNYVFDSKLDLSGSYRVRTSSTTGITEFDQSLLAGATGTILPKLSGGISAGFERANEYSKGLGENAYNDITAGINLYWRYSRVFSFNGSVSKDFNITAEDVETNATAESAVMDAALGHRWRTNAGITHVGTDFLGRAGLGRRDSLWQFSVNAGTGLTTHIRVNFGYVYEINYSNLSSAEFWSQSYNVSIFASY